MSNLNEQTVLVYCVVRYGQIIGLYRQFDDASQVMQTSIAKGQVCDVIVKPLN